MGYDNWKTTEPSFPEDKPVEEEQACVGGMKRKLYIEFRVEVDSHTNQDLLFEAGEIAKDILYDHFDGGEYETGPVPAAKDVTYEVIMVVEKDEGVK